MENRLAFSLFDFTYIKNIQIAMDILSIAIGRCQGSLLYLSFNIREKEFNFDFLYADLIQDLFGRLLRRWEIE